jgi:tetratricopeptide (TPR) repeat protein
MAAAAASDLVRQANACVSKSDFAGAVKHLTDAIGIADTKEVRANRAFAWTALGRNEEALTDAKHCIAIAPTFSKGYLRAGRALIALGRLKDAATLLEDAAEKMPQDYALQEALEDALQKLEAGGGGPGGGAGEVASVSSASMGSVEADGTTSTPNCGLGASSAGGLSSSYYYAAVPASERKLPVAAPQRIDPQVAATNGSGVAAGHVREDIERKGMRECTAAA